METFNAKNMKAQIKKETIQDYLAKVEYISSHGLMNILRSPFHYKKLLERKKPPSKSMIIGSAFHSLLLEPKVFAEQYAVFCKPEADKTMSSKANKEGFERLKTGNPYKTILIEDDANVIIQMADEVNKVKGAKDLLNLKGNVEESIYLEVDKIKIKIRPDKYTENGALIDVKTTKNAHPDAFRRDCLTYHYDLQLAFYADMLKEVTGTEYKDLFIIAVENNYPYACQVYSCSETGFIDIGRGRYQKAMEIYKECLKSGKYPGYEKLANNDYGIYDLSLPDWFLKDNID